MYLPSGIKQKESGQSLVEAVVAVGLAIVIATALISATTTGLKAGQSGKLRSKAVILVQDGIEQTRILRDSGWTALQNRDAQIWCLSKTSEFIKTTDCPYDAENPSNPYYRSVTYTWDSANSRMKVDSVVSWNERSQVKNVTLTTYFTDWR